MPRTSTGQVTFFDDRGNSEYALSYRLRYRIYPGDPGCMYTRNGDGRPATTPQCEIEDAVAVGLGTEDEDYTLADHEGRSLGLDFMAEIESDRHLREQVEEACYSDDAESWEAARDMAADARFEAMRCR